MLLTNLTNWEVFAIFVPLIVAAISFSFNVWNNIRELNYKKNVLEESKIMDKRKELAKKLNEFYGPFQQNMKKSTTLYKALTDNKGDFRLLDYLLSPSIYETLELNQNDFTLIDEIVEMGKLQQELIKKKGGLIDNPVLTYYYYDENTDFKFPNERRDLHRIGLIPRVNAHYRILALAKEGKLKGDIERFKDYRFPRSLPEEIDKRIQELKKELNSLRKLK